MPAVELLHWLAVTPSSSRAECRRGPALGRGCCQSQSLCRAAALCWVAPLPGDPTPGHISRCTSEGWDCPEGTPDSCHPKKQGKCRSPLLRCQCEIPQTQTLLATGQCLH